MGKIFRTKPSLPRLSSSQVRRTTELAHGLYERFSALMPGGLPMVVERAVGNSSLIEVLDRVLDKGIVIDAWVRVSLAGIDLVTIDARVVVASIATYFQSTEAVDSSAIVASAFAASLRKALWCTN